MLDQDGDGALDLDELKNVLGPNIPTEVYGLIVEEFDENKNGLVSGGLCRFRRRSSWR